MERDEPRRLHLRAVSPHLPVPHPEGDGAQQLRGLDHLRQRRHDAGVPGQVQAEGTQGLEVLLSRDHVQEKNILLYKNSHGERTHKCIEYVLTLLHSCWDTMHFILFPLQLPHFFQPLSFLLQVAIRKLSVQYSIVQLVCASKTAPPTAPTVGQQEIHSDRT